MERLSLPEPARTMWKRIRGVVNDLVPGNDSCKAFLTGGTLLAARWMAACGIYGTLTDTYAIQPGEALARIRTGLSERDRGATCRTDLNG